MQLQRVTIKIKKQLKLSSLSENIEAFLNNKTREDFFCYSDKILGFVLYVENTSSIIDNFIVNQNPEDIIIFYTVSLLTLKLEVNDFLKVVISSIDNRFNLKVKLGILEGYIHNSQLPFDNPIIGKNNDQITSSTDKKKKLTLGQVVRVKVSMISTSKNTVKILESYRFKPFFSMRSHFTGLDSWYQSNLK